jgi:hypothetical protein
MKKIALTALVAVSVLPAFGQDYVPHNLSVRLGGFFPTNGAAKDESKTWLGVGAQYTFRTGIVQKESGYSADLAVSLDYYGRGDFRALPVMVNYIGHMSPKLWYTGGVGASFSRYPKGGSTDSSVEFAYALGVGYNLIEGKQPIFVEGRYWGNSESKLSGFAIYAGIRF